MKENIESGKPGETHVSGSQAAQFNVHRHDVSTSVSQSQESSGVSKRKAENVGSTDSDNDARFVSFKRLPPPMRRGKERDVYNVVKINAESKDDVINTKKIKKGKTKRVSLAELMKERDRLDDGAGGVVERSEQSDKKRKMLEVYYLKPENVRRAKERMFKYIGRLQADRQRVLEPLKSSMQTVYNFHCLVDYPISADMLGGAWNHLKEQVTSSKDPNLKRYLEPLIDDTYEWHPDVKQRKLDVASMHLDEQRSKAGRDLSYDESVLSYVMEMPTQRFTDALAILRSAVATPKIHDKLSSTKRMLSNIETVKSYMDEFPGEKLFQEGGARPGKSVAFWNDTFCIVLDSHPDSAVRRAWKQLHTDKRIAEASKESHTEEKMDVTEESNTEGKAEIAKELHTEEMTGASEDAPVAEQMAVPEVYRYMQDIHSFGLEKVDNAINTIILGRRGISENRGVVSRMDVWDKQVVSLVFKEREKVRIFMESIKDNYFSLPVEKRAAQMFAVVGKWRSMLDIFDNTDDEFFKNIKKDVPGVKAELTDSEVELMGSEGEWEESESDLEMYQED